MSHWGPSAQEMINEERIRKAQKTEPEALLTAIMQAVKEARPAQYRSFNDLVAMSPETHAERLRVAILEAVRGTAYRLNVEAE